jgi:hypothetical protein
MTDDQLRALVRDAVARHLAHAAPDATALAAAPTPAPASAMKHPGFHRYRLPRGDDDDGPCLIEPAVRCTHCGFCQSHGY